MVLTNSCLNIARQPGISSAAGCGRALVQNGQHRPSIMGAGSLAVNAVKGVLGGGGGDAHKEVDKHAKEASSNGNDSISKALESLSKSGETLLLL